MLVKKNYKRNRKANEIVKREIVEVCCDLCGNMWETPFYNRKRKILKEDLCSSCRCKHNGRNIGKALKARWDDSLRKIKEIECSFCKTIFERLPIQTNQGNNFCSLNCRDSFNFKTKYEHLEKSFCENNDEVAYLIGLILGDGHLKKSGTNTTRISIAFDANEKWSELINIAKIVFDILEINWYEDPNKRTSCVMIGFILPNFILEKYGILFHGNKFDANPYPSKEIVENINFAAGLLNSDGCFNKNCYYFTNTVHSISQSLFDCFDENGINHREYEVSNRIDKRNGSVNKKQYAAYSIGGRKTILDLHSKVKFELKGQMK